MQILIWLGSALLGGFVVHVVIFKFLAYLTKRSTTVLGQGVMKHLRGPARFILPLLFVHIVMPMVSVGEEMRGFLKQIFGLFFIGVVGWMAVKVFLIVEDIILARFKMETTDNLQARKVHTQLRILRKIVVILVGILTMAAILMTFEKIRYLGTSILASAGILGIIIGFAAQRSIATLFAGIQVALTQPIRIDDVVIVENEWGRIEEITLTYVVVKIWDQRRLIVPITHFLEKPFQNWTRTTAELLGTIFLYVDYTAPLGIIREQLKQIVETSQLWDRRVCALQITGTSEKTIELRILVSAADASAAWELRCYVREKLIEFLRSNFPGVLPRLRTQILPEPD